MDNNLAKYLAFVRTAETGSFTKAAQTMNYAQSSVSKMVADLECDWGVILLERTHSGVTLTPTGRQLLPLAADILNNCRKLEGVISQINGIQTGTVRIGTFASVAINRLPNIFSVFQKMYPGIEYELLLGDYDEIEKWISDGRVDCGFLRLPTAAMLDSILLEEDEYKLVLPIDHPLAQNDTVDIKTLENEPFLLLERGGKTEVSDILESNGVHPDISFTTWEDFAIMAMAEKGLGVGILPSIILQRIPYKIAIRSLNKPYYRQIGICFKNGNQLPPAAQKFIEYLCTIKNQG